MGLDTKFTSDQVDFSFVFSMHSAFSIVNCVIVFLISFIWITFKVGLETKFKIEILVDEVDLFLVFSVCVWHLPEDATSLISF